MIEKQLYFGDTLDSFLLSANSSKIKMGAGYQKRLIGSLNYSG